MKNKKHKRTVVALSNETNLICDYGCGQKAQFLIGTAKRPCCSKNTASCKAVVARSIAKGKQTKKERYNDENWNNSEKRAKTNLEKYGNTCSLHGKEQEEKTKQTWLKNYGVENRLDSPAVQQKMRQGVFNNYGVFNPFQIPDIIELIQDKNRKHQKEITAKSVKTRNSRSAEENAQIRHNTQITVRSNRYEELLKNTQVIPIFKKDEFINIENLYKDPFRWKCLRCGKEFESHYGPYIIRDDLGNYIETVYGRCLDCFPHAKSDGISREELQVYDFVKSIYAGTILQSKHILKNYNVKGSHGLQLDIFLPELNIGIEYNGVYFHSVELVAPQYHLLKTKLAEEQGIKLIHIRSDQWLTQNEQVKCLLRDIITGTLKLKNIYTSDIAYVDRSIFNKCFKLEGYKLIDETETNKIQVLLNNKTFMYEDSGFLIYKKL